jgi:hypothetical protein
MPSLPQQQRMKDKTRGTTAMNRFHPLGGALLAAACGLFPSGIAHAQQQNSVPRQYDGIQAGLDAYRLGEERRRSDLGQQLDVNEQMRAWSGLPGLYGETMWYREPVSAYRRRTLDALYGNGSTYGGYPVPIAPPVGVFAPWPYVPGDIWGYSYYTPWRQPVGRWEGQTGPNRWESHPIYDPPLDPPLAPTPSAQPVAPRSIEPSDDPTDDLLPPPPTKKPRLYGPTEF